jgi:hypothetical protein
MVVDMPVNDESSKVSLNHNDQGATPDGGASCRDSVIGDLVSWRTPIAATFRSVLSAQQNGGESIIGGY